MLSARRRLAPAVVTVTWEKNHVFAIQWHPQLPQTPMACSEFEAQAMTGQLPHPANPDYQINWTNTWTRDGLATEAAWPELDGATKTTAQTYNTLYSIDAEGKLSVEYSLDGVLYLVRTFNRQSGPKRGNDLFCGVGTCS